jgi:hypothetical protein
MSYIGNTPGVSSQRVVLEEVVSGSPKSTFVPQSGYIIGYVDVLVNGLEIDSSDFTAPDGVNINLVTAAAVGDTVKVKTWLPRGLSDGYLKTEADAKFATKVSPSFTGTAAFDATVAAWWSGGKQLQLGAGTALFDYSAAGNSQSRLLNNLYLDSTGSYRYLTTNNAGYYQQFNGIHSWGRAPNGTAGALASTTDSMVLDASGRLTVPAQPSVLAYRSSGAISGAGQITYNGTIHNVGSCYSTSTGKFTAPVAGTYFVSAFTISTSSGGSGYWSIRKNGVAIMGADWSGSGYVNSSASGILQLAQGDLVDVYNYTGSLYGSNSSENCFSVHMIG